MKIIPAHYKCPRCNGTDQYFAKRVVGQVGGVLDTSNSSFNPGFVRPIEVDVALCRSCGERMNFIKKREIMETPQEFLAAKHKLEKEKKKLHFSVVFYISLGIIMVVIFSL
jgi:hypothetical protein